jgi:hypothetical protein
MILLQRVKSILTMVIIRSMPAGPIETQADGNGKVFFNARPARAVISEKERLGISHKDIVDPCIVNGSKVISFGPER